MKSPLEIPGIKNITISGRIASGATTLANSLSEVINWRILDGGQLFRKINQELGVGVSDSDKRPDKFDIEYEERIKKILQQEEKQIIQSHLSGFDARGIVGIFKILIVCEDQDGNDKTEIRIDRLVNRDKVSIEKAKYEVIDRDKNDLDKFRRLYADNNQNWVYWDKKYYDLVINTYSHNPEETLKFVLRDLKINQ